MLSTLQEQMAHQIANERDIPTLLRLIRTLLPINNGNGNTNHVGGVVHVGRDTRSHSPGLSELVVRTIVAMGLPVINHGILTTPMLHHCVLHANAHHYLPLYIPIRPHRKGYLDLLAYSYWSLIQTTTTSPNTFSSGPLVLDCACGVGYQAIIDLHHRLQSVSCGNARPLQARNAPGEGPLNVGCGSEVVQKNIQPPAWYGDMDIDVDSSSHSTKTSTTPTSTEVPYAASIDGDADRIVFFSTTSTTFTMMDGDKIAVLICEFFQELLEQLYALDPTLPQLTLGVVQTAYANGASTQYLKVSCHSRLLRGMTAKRRVPPTDSVYYIGTPLFLSHSLFPSFLFVVKYIYINIYCYLESNGTVQSVDCQDGRQTCPCRCSFF
jgi:phosphoacetylglucosamine mutase